jgi:hypothetical protein
MPTNTYSLFSKIVAPISARYSAFSNINWKSLVIASFTSSGTQSIDENLRRPEIGYRHRRRNTQFGARPKDGFTKALTMTTTTEFNALRIANEK